MMQKRATILVLLIVLFSFPEPSVHAGWSDWLKTVQDTIKGKEKLTEADIVQGLKEALEIGTDNTVQMVGRLNGYYKTPEIKIPLPDSVQKVENLLRTSGFGEKVDEFELTMNRAAEEAAPQAKAIFWEAIRNMTFTDAKQILNGRENEATLYFQAKTTSELEQSFRPIVHQALANVGVTRTYQDLNTKLKTIPFAEGRSFDIDQYVTEKALDGLFYMLAQEESKIRNDPAARVTDLLKRVFGGQ